MNWLALMKKVPPEIVDEIEKLEDFEKYIPYFKKFIEFKQLATGIRVGEVGANVVSTVLSTLGTAVNERQAEAIAGAIRTFCPDPQANLMEFLREGGLQHILAGIATPKENLDTDNAIRCPHCHGLIVRPQAHPAFDDLIVCQHCGGVISN